MTPGVSEEGAPTATSRAAAAYARLVVALRWPILAAWAAGAVFVAVNVAGPRPRGRGTSSRSSPSTRRPSRRPGGRPARSTCRSPRRSRSSSATRTASPLQEQRRRGRTGACDRPARRRGDPPFLVLPVTNTAGAMPGSRESSTAVISYFVFPPVMSFEGTHPGRRPLHGRRPQGRRAGGRPHRHPPGAAARGDDRRGRAALRRGGHDPHGGAHRRAQVPVARGTRADARDGRDRLPDGAPRHRAPERGHRARRARHPEAAHGRARPRDRHRLHHLLRIDDADARRSTGMPRSRGARQATAQITPIVVAGGAILAASLAALQVAQLSFFRAVGPGLAVVGARGARGRRSRSCRPRWRCSGGRSTGRACRRGAFGEPEAGTAIAARPAPGPASARLRRRGACLAALAAAAWQRPTCGSGSPPSTAFPRTRRSVRRQRPSDRRSRPGCSRRPRSWSRAPARTRPGSSGSRPPSAASRASPQCRAGGAARAGRRAVVFVRGDAARYNVVFDSDPHGATAIDDVEPAARSTPGLARSAGLDGARVSVAGDTALADDTISAHGERPIRVAHRRLCFVNLAPARALPARAGGASSCSWLVERAQRSPRRWGSPVWVFQTFLGYGELTYYVPFAAVRAARVARLGLQRLHRRPGVAGGPRAARCARPWRRPRRRRRGAISHRRASRLRSSFALLAIIHGARRSGSLHSSWP